MSQHDLDIANQGFPATRADINNALQALGSSNSGATAPSTTYANQLWYDTANNIIKIRNEDNDAWISLFTLDQTADNIEALTINGTLTADALTVDTDTLHVDATNNNVGIGTASPNNNSGRTTLTIDNSSQGGAIDLEHNGTVVGKFLCDGANTLGIQADGNRDMLFKTNGSSRMIVSGGGNVGIGTTSPQSLLHCYADSEPVLRFQNTGTGTGSSDGSFVGLGSGTYGLRVHNYEATPIRFATGNTERIVINSSGGLNVGSGVLSAASSDGDIVADLGVVIGTFNGDNRIAASSLGGGSATLYIGNAAIQVSSDQRLKTNIADTTMTAVDKINQVRVVDFNWNDPSDTSFNNRNARGTWTGVLAQELVSVFPFAVNAPRDENDLSIDTNSDKKWQVDHANLVPVLMKAIQEQQASITTLETQLADLEARLTALEA